jgi:hypothetical protein
MSRISHVLAGCAATCYLKGEQGSNELELLLADRRNFVVIHQLTLMEVYSQFLKLDGREVAETAWTGCTSVASIEAECSADFLKRAARWLASDHLTVGEAVAGATAEDNAAVLVTFAEGPLTQAAARSGQECLVLTSQPGEPAVSAAIAEGAEPLASHPSGG